MDVRRVPSYKKMLKCIALFIVLMLPLFFIIFPIYWTITTSLKYKQDIMLVVPQYIPQRLTLEHYVEIFARSGFGRFTWNSTLIAVTTTLLCGLVASMAGFGLTRFTFKGRKTISSGIYVIRMIPGLIYMVPLFMIFRQMNLIDNPIGLILAYCTFSLPMSIWLFLSFYEEIPHDLYEAAIIDGCSEYRLFRSIALPLVAPSISVVAILCFLGAWNEFGLAMCLTFKDVNKTLPVAINSLIQRESDTPFGSIAAGGTLVMLPAIILSLFTQKYIVRGFTAGAVKG